MWKRSVKCFIVFMLIVFLTFSVSDVYAATYTLSTSYNICYNKSTGKYTGTSGCSYFTTYKKLNGAEAYCTQLNKSISNKSYTKDSSFSSTSKNALIAGKAIELVKSKFSSTDERYLYTTELINYIFKLSGYSDYVSKNSTLKTIYDEAVDFVTNTAKYSGNAATKLPTITLSSENGNNMNSTSTTKTYISNKITLKGLVSNYGSGNGTNNGDTTYKISVSSNSGSKVYVCTDAAGKNCTENSVTLSKPTATSKSYYIKVTSGTPGGDVKISVTGSNKSTYPSVTKYSSNSASQILMVGGTVSFSRTVSTSLSLSIPDSTKHTIKVYKVDEFGNSLNGASLSLYKVNSRLNVSSISDLKDYTPISMNSDGSSTLSYSVTNSDDNDDFFQWKYCVAESNSPSGYILPSSAVCYEPTTSSSTTCLDSNSETVDLNYCGAYYTCESGELSGSSCLITESVDPTTSCPEGYSWNSEGTKCEKVDVTDPVIECPTGYTLSADDNSVCISDVDNSVTTGSTLGCTSGNLESDNKCYTISSASPNYSCSDGYTFDTTVTKCIKTEPKPATCIGGNGNSGSQYCENSDQYTKVVQSGDNLTVTKINNKTNVTISKKDATGDNEVPGAVLKICSDKPDENGDCTVVTLKQKGIFCPLVSSELDESESNVSNCSYDESTDTRTISLKWSSTDVARTWTGLETGKTYYLVEETPPNGYIVATITTEFTISPDGTVMIGGQSVTDNIIVVNNSLTEMSISKQDVSSSKEVPGATLSICESHLDDEGNLEMSVDDFGNCTVVTLADGSAATWVSTDQPHSVRGLGAGTYYLVENVAPDGYDTAESIIFTMNKDGSVSDINGKSLADNKLVMYDGKLVTVTTGDLPILIIIVLAVLGVGFVIYYKNNKDIIQNKINKIRKRKKINDAQK